MELHHWHDMSFFPCFPFSLLPLLLPQKEYKYGHNQAIWPNRRVKVESQEFPGQDDVQLDRRGSGRGIPDRCIFLDEVP